MKLFPSQLSCLFLFFLFVLPSSTQYEIHDYSFGGAGTGVSNSGSYSLSGVAGEVSGGLLTGSTYDLGPGLQFARQANTPGPATLTNSNNYYNKLYFAIDDGDNPTDTLFAIAISDDNFVTTNYLQADNTIGSSPVYQTYSAWGGAVGEHAVGLSSNTTYTIKVKAIQTKYNESAFSQIASAATTAPSLSYDIDISSSDSETAAPYLIEMGTLTLGGVTTASEKIWIDLDTNAEAGAFVYVSANGAGLTSANAGKTILSTSGDLNALSEGFGLQIANTSQSSGTLVPTAPYNGNNQVVGIIDTTSRTIFSSNNLPISAARGSILVKAKADPSTPAAADYSSIITLIASTTF